MNLLTPDQLKLETFSPWLKSKFRVALDSASFLEVELAEANALTYPGQLQPGAKGPTQDSFTLVFHGPDNRFLPQRMYPFEHDQIGRFELFIVPIGQKPGFIQYQAIFNRLTKPG
jgi:hypothetical protein